MEKNPLILKMNLQLKKIIDSKGLKQTFVAKQMDIHSTQLSRIINGQSCSLDLFTRIIEQLDCEIIIKPKNHDND